VSADLPDEFPGDLLGDIAASEPGLEVLLSHLTSAPSPDELAGEDAALAMFLASRPQAALQADLQQGAAQDSPHQAAFQAYPHQAAFQTDPQVSAPGPHGWPVRRVRRLAVAATIAIAATFITAAYTATLPAPLQNVAYRVLGFAGIPHAARTRSAPGGSGPGATAPSHSAVPGQANQEAPGKHGGPSASPASSRPRGSGGLILTVTIASSRIVAGTSEVFNGSLTDKGQPVARASLSLLERTVSQPAWHIVGSATTGSRGSAVVTVPDLTANAEFRFTGPDRAVSRPVLVIVAPTVFATVAIGPHGRLDLITAISPLAEPGDQVVLEVRSGTRWVTVQVRRLDGAERTEFPVNAGSRQQSYRVVLLPTGAHGRSVSNTVNVGPNDTMRTSPRKSASQAGS
jgi:hypothetical protein